MGYEQMIPSVLDEIDKRIKENISADELAREANYSVHHFRRVFTELIGIPFVNYVTRRKLEYALYELSQGRRIIDAAMDFGFETHAGFTKAFKKHFGCPPSLYQLHVTASPPVRAIVCSSKLKHGGIIMQFEIKEIKPFSVVGYCSRHKMPGVRKMSDIPVFWEKINLEYASALSTLHNIYTKSHHCETAVCFDIDEEHNCFTYMLGVGVDKADSGVPQKPGTYRCEIQGGLYAVFTTPLVDEDEYVRSIDDTWKQILGNWLPESKYEYDSARTDFEYYDERDHSWIHGGKSQMDIYIPVRERKVN
jgi:AraC family transcriptional regulator